VPRDPATLVPPREGARPEHETKQLKQLEQLCIYMLVLYRQEPTTSANRSKSCPRDLSSHPKTHFSSYLAKNTLLRPIQNPYIARYIALALTERLSHWHSLTSSYRPYRHLLASSYRL
jgi:hypothetical protein